MKALRILNVVMWTLAFFCFLNACWSHDPAEIQSLMMSGTLMFSVGMFAFLGWIQ